MKSLRIRRLVLLTIAAALVAGGCQHGVESSQHDLPEALRGVDPLELGALLCVSSPFAAKAPDLERTALLAQNYINGCHSAYPDLPVEEIPCRKRGNCGVWVGPGQRAPLELVIADSAERPARGVAAAKAILARGGVPALIGPCSAEVLHAVQEQVTGTDTVLVSPVATADSVTEIDDRKPADKQQGLPGYVFRTITPDYVQAEVLGQLAANLEDPPILVRHEDQTDDECTTEDSGYCVDRYASQGQFRCLPLARTAEPEREFYRFTDTECGDLPDGFCDSLGRNYECIDHPNGGEARICARYRTRRFCTRLVRPETAMVLYPDSAAGRALKTEVERYWVDRRGHRMLVTVAYDASKPATFASTIQRLFFIGDFEVGKLKQQGELPPDYQLGDSVVFLFAEETAGALLLQEWSTQGETLGKTADQVFWLATDILRNRIVLSQLSFEALRNLFVVDPYTVDINNQSFFEQTFTRRWGLPPGDYAGNLFDAVLALALANERAGVSQGRNDASALKDSLPAVTVGCAGRGLGETCSDPGAITVVNPEGFSRAIELIGEGQPVRYQGVTGDLSLSPEGDRISNFRIWSVAQTATGKQFQVVDTYTPQAHGIGLRR